MNLGISVAAGALLMTTAVHDAEAAAPDATNKAVEQKIWNLLGDEKAVYVTLPEADFRALGEGFELPDGGKTVTDLAKAAPGGAFDPRDLHKVAADKLGYKAEWIVDRYKRYNMDWDITGLKLTSSNPEAKKYPWFIIMNGGAANFYEFYVDLKNRPGWAQFLAQKMNVMIVTIPGNFKYGGWDEPIQSLKRQPQYLLDRDLPMPESELRNALLNNRVVMQGLKSIVTKHTQGDILLIGHSTSGELAMMAYEDPELAPRLKGRFFGWGSGGAARLDPLRPYANAKKAASGTTTLTEAVAGAKERPGLEVLTRRDTKAYSRGYSWFLNPLYEPGMSLANIADVWLAAEARRRPQFKQQIQDLEHSGDNVVMKGWVESEIQRLIQKSGNPWKINYEDVAKDLYSTIYTRLDGYKKMVWTVGHMDRNHWVPEDPMTATEVYFATQYRKANPDAQIRLIVWDPPMTHYGHVELPKEKAAADFSVVRWLMK
ncbi:MAG: hypothetical protein JWL91_1721 [Sphingomonas bacterium]|nr:hypothetical protein [Sphingomonas bacterium]MDB5689845.1 hypothetical protein [Sphingomonas bacterium]